MTPGGRYWEGENGERQTDANVAFADHIHRATALAMLGRNEDAQTVLRPIATGASNARLWSMMIEDGEATSLLEAKPCQAFAQGNERLAGVGGNLITWGMNADARSLLERALQVDPKSPTAVANMVHLLIVEGQLNDAIRLGESALAHGVDDAMRMVNLGYAYQESGACEEALPLMKAARVLRPRFEPGYTNLARCLETVGSHAEAARFWR